VSGRLSSEKGKGEDSISKNFPLTFTFLLCGASLPAHPGGSDRRIQPKLK
jgi:hypothetical protein